MSQRAFFGFLLGPPFIFLCSRFVVTFHVTSIEISLHFLVPLSLALLPIRFHLRLQGLARGGLRGFTSVSFIRIHLGIDHRLHAPHPADHPVYVRSHRLSRTVDRRFVAGFDDLRDGEVGVVGRRRRGCRRVECRRRRGRHDYG